VTGPLVITQHVCAACESEIVASAHAVCDSCEDRCEHCGQSTDECPYESPLDCEEADAADYGGECRAESLREMDGAL